RGPQGGGRAPDPRRAWAEGPMMAPRGPGPPAERDPGDAAGMDAPAPVRPGEEIDSTSLLTWLAAEVPELAGRAMTVRQFPRGHSNLTYLLTFTGPGGEPIEVVLRRPPLGDRAASAHD